MKIKLCGSGRFGHLFDVWGKALTMAGHHVLWSDDPREAIAESDALFVINEHAYIGESTMDEIKLAKQLGKRLYALGSWGEGCGIVGESYMKLARDAKAADDVPANYVSPIDTTLRNGFYGPWDLLGPAGQLRNQLVEAVKRARGDIAPHAFPKLEEGPQVPPQSGCLVSDAKRLKQELETKIKVLIDDYHIASGLLVTRVDVQLHYLISGRTPPVEVEVEVRVP